MLLQLLNEDLTDYIQIEYVWGDETEFPYMGFEDNGAIIEWNCDEIQELLENTIEHKQCSSVDEFFLDHLTSYVEDE